MKALTKTSTTALMGLLALALSSAAMAGPNGPRPGGPKLSIDVYNDCSARATYLDITTEVTPSGSKSGDGGAEIQTPSADAAFKGEVCRTNPRGRENCSAGFVPAGAPELMDFAGADPLTWTASIDLCALDPTLTAGTIINAEVSVPVKYDDDVTTTWISQCDDDPDTYCIDDEGEPYVCEEFDESIVEVAASCPTE